MKAKLVKEYIELPPKSKEQILSDMKLMSKKDLNKTLLNVCFEYPIDINKVKMLIDGGADINAKDNIGGSSLMYASYYGRKDVVKLLLDNGADVNVKDKDGWTALTRASKKQNKNITDLLRKYGAKE